MTGLTIEKNKVGKDFRHVIKTSDLVNLLDPIDPIFPIHLIYQTAQRNNITECWLIEAEYWLPNQNVNHSRFYMRIGAVPSAETSKIRIQLITDVLPKLAEWVASCKKYDASSTQKPGRFFVFWKNGQITINGKPLSG